MIEPVPHILAAAGFGAVDDGAGCDLPPGLRNRAIAALGDAVVPQIAEAIGRAMLGLAERDAIDARCAAWKRPKRAKGRIGQHATVTRLSRAGQGCTSGDSPVLPAILPGDTK